MKRILAGIFALVIVFGLVTTTQLRAEAVDTSEEITAYLTITLQDTDGNYDFAKSKDGSEMAAKAIQVSDQDGDGKLTAYDMLYCAHLQCATGGLNDYGTSSTGSGNVVLTKVWNVTDDFTFVGENTMATKSLQTNIKATGTALIDNGTHLYVVQGKQAKTDIFSNESSIKMSFINDAKITAYEKNLFTLGVYTFDTTKTPMKYASVTQNRKVYYKKAGTMNEMEAVTTDSDGKINIRNLLTGDYLFYTKGASGIAPAACMVHVEESGLVPTNIQLGLSNEDKADLLNYNVGTKEYTITVPDDTKALYGYMEYTSAPFNLLWYSETSTDGETYNSTTMGKGVLDGKTAGRFSIKDAKKLKLYVNDVSQQMAKNSPLSDEYIINIKRQVQLTGLETSGQVASSADFKTGALDVYVAHNAESATLTPTATTGDTITVNETPADSGEAVTVLLNDQETKATIVVHREGEGYADGSYTVTFHKADESTTPVFRENLTSELLEYITDDNESSLKTLHVLADANGEVSYQWYYNTTASTEGGTAIQDATDRSYRPPNNQATDRYYYCVASNGETNTASNLVHVIVYDGTKFSVDWDMDVPNIPEDKVSLFDGSQKGFYYQKGDTNVTPLKVKLTLPENFAKKFEDGTATITYSWNCSGSGAYSSDPTYTPKTDIAYGLQQWYCSVHIKFAGRGYNVYGNVFNTKVNVYVDRAGQSTPDTITFNGKGTEQEPYELSAQTDLETLRTYVSQGYDFADTYLLLTKDITLDDKWTSIGEGNAGTKGKGWKTFSGTLDGGNHTLTYAEGTDQPLFKYVREATVKNLNIKAPYLKNYGLVSDYGVDYGDDGNYNVGAGGSYASGCPDTIDIINVTIKSGSVIQKSGFIGGFASGANVVNIRDCVVEENVKIGWDKENDCSAGGSVGSFGGSFNGTITNCVSQADVYGGNFVGGLVGQKGQSMGPYDIINCSFTGTVTSTGHYVGGIAGGGYCATSAPNTPAATIQNCYVSGTITGLDNVGGILGGEAQIQAWNTSYIQDNCFYGTVCATGEDASCGAIIGRLKSLNKNNVIENNYFVEDCGAENGIGTLHYLDTSANVEAPEGCTVFNSKVRLPDESGISRKNVNRTDDPLGKDADQLAAKKTAEEFKDDTVVTLLNGSESSLKNWEKGTTGPVHSRTPVWSKIAISGTYKTEYVIGEELDLSDAVFTATRSDGLTKEVSLEDVQISGYDKTVRGNQTITVKYGVASCAFEIRVLKPASSDIRVSFTLLGDHVHTEDETEVHTLADGNLETWIKKKSFTVSNNATVLDVITKAFDAANAASETEVFSSENPTGNYIESITYNGTTLGEFTNGDESGWMYTLNGKHPGLGVSEQYLENGDVIVFHYTDDYTLEEGSEHWGPGNGSSSETDKPEEPEGNVETLFSDVKGHWGVKAIQYVYDKSLMNGITETEFAPEMTLSRGMLATVLYRMAGEPPVKGESRFPDVEPGSWYEAAIIWATENGIVKGFDDGYFYPEEEVSREQAAAMFRRYAAWKSQNTDAQADLSDFRDAEKISAWAEADLSWANAVGLITGKDNDILDPGGDTTRVEAATILMRFCENIVK